MTSKDLHFTRRGALAASALTLAACAAPSTPSGSRTSKTYVLVHGAWHGAWCWSHVATSLRQQGHQVFLPTQTGLGDRHHLMAADITLDTFVQDVVSAIEAEELRDVVLVGHSFGGLSISGAADRIPERVRHLVYLDSLILQPGHSVLDALPPEARAARRKAFADAGHTIPAPAPSYFGVPDGPDADWVRRRMTPHPSGTWDSPLRLTRAPGLPGATTYISCTAPALKSVAAHAEYARGQSDWKVLELPTGHDAMVTAPEALSAMLAGIG
jgi:pimeloyl-ACP methyl ester carboxylesterase